MGCYESFHFYLEAVFLDHRRFFFMDKKGETIGFLITQYKIVLLLIVWYGFFIIYIVKLFDSGYQNILFLVLFVWMKL